MNIGIDIDGVLTDFQRATIDYGTKMCIEENWPINLDVSEYWEKRAFNWTEEQTTKFWNTYFLKYIRETSARDFAAEIIEKLQRQGNKIYIITAREDDETLLEYNGKMEELTREWLESKGIKYDKLIFAKNEDKLEKCLENNVQVMIEDNPQNIQYISDKIKVIKFYCQYNKNVNNNNIITAYSWHHIYQIINEMQKNFDY